MKKILYIIFISLLLSSCGQQEEIIYDPIVGSWYGFKTVSEIGYTTDGDPYSGILLVEIQLTFYANGSFVESCLYYGELQATDYLGRKYPLIIDEVVEKSGNFYINGNTLTTVSSLETKSYFIHFSDKGEFLSLSDVYESITYIRN